MKIVEIENRLTRKIVMVVYTPIVFIFAILICIIAVLLTSTLSALLAFIDQFRESSIFWIGKVRETFSDVKDCWNK